MEDLILYDVNRKKKQIIRNCIEYDCAIGRNAYSDNDFILKTPFDKNDLYEVGEWVSYGYTEYGGIIRSREIDTANETVTYTGQSFRGILSTILENFVINRPDKYSGTPHGIMNEILRRKSAEILGVHIFPNNPPLNRIYTATGEDTTEAEVGAYSTSGLICTNILYLHDNIVKSFSTAENKPIKSRFSFHNGVITIEFVDGNTFYFDSDKAKLKYAENKNTPNFCYCSTRKVPNEENTGESYVAKTGYAFLRADGSVTHDWTEWVCYTNAGTEEICLVAESTGEANNNDDETPLWSEAADRLLEAQEKPSAEIEIDTEEAEVDDVIVASIAELNMKVTKKVVESRLKISNGIPKITYTLEG
ncbi:MAG: hypothetical protein IJR33_08520 [Clostridia bacterium]|nr:hypothetical protein [Clostridia bacterium]